MAAAGGAGRAAAADITEEDKRVLVLYPLYRVDIIKDSIDFGGITSLAARQKVRFIVNTLFKMQEMRYNLTNYTTITNDILQRYANLLTENIFMKDWRQGQYYIVDEELQNFTQRPILYPTCHLGYFQDRDPSESIVVPALYNKKSLKEFTEYHVNFGIHDSGKAPKFFDKNILQVQTPGSFIDPASRSPADNLHMINLDASDFRTMGLAHLLDTLQVSESSKRGVKYIVSLSLNGSTKFTFDFTDNVNNPAPYKVGNNNNLLAGNPVKNAYINSDSSTYEEIMNYILVKLLGDLLQVYYGRKLINNKTYKKNKICIFTSDNNVLRLAQIFQVPCLIQNLEHKLQGSERNYYTYYAYKSGKDPTQDPITSNMRINKLECNKVIKHNAGVIRTFTECLEKNEIYVGVTLFKPIPDRVRKYMSNACGVIADVNNEIKSIHTNLELINMDPLEFKEYINRHRATDAVRFTHVDAGIYAYSALTTRFIFSLLKADNVLNTRINALKGTHESIEFRQFVYGRNIRVRDVVPEGAGARAGADAGAGAAAPAAGSRMEEESDPPSGAGAAAPAAGSRMKPKTSMLENAKRWLQQVTSIDTIINSIGSLFFGIFRGGNRKKGAGAAGGNNGDDDIPFSTLLDETPYDKLNNIIEDAIHEAIVRMEPKPDIFVEDVLALIYPYFALTGQFSINFIFYGWFISYITNATFTGYIDKGLVDSAYERIHSPPRGAGDVAAGGAGAVAYAAPGPGYDINGQVFLQPPGKKGAMNTEDAEGAAAAGGAGAAAPAAILATAAAEPLGNLYNNVPSVLKRWQGSAIINNIKTRSNMYDAWALYRVAMAHYRGARSAAVVAARAAAAAPARARARAAALNEAQAEKTAAKRAMVMARTRVWAAQLPAASAVAAAAGMAIKDGAPGRGAEAPGGYVDAAAHAAEAGGGGGGRGWRYAGGRQPNLEHAGGARIRKTRKKRVNTLRRKLRKFRDTGRI